MAERKPNSIKKQKQQVEIHKQRDMCRVESGDGKYGGYRKDTLTENLTDREKTLLICGICKAIMREACLTSSGEQICSCCEVQGQKSSTTNTISRVIKSKHAKRLSKQTPNNPVRKMVDSLKCSCPLLERGCQWFGTLKECEEHLDTCGHVRDQCKLQCGAVLQRNELSVHEEVECSLCIVKCKHCKGDLQLGDMPNHLDVCPKMKVSCELNCHTIVPRENMVQHLEQECGMVVEMCKLGCGTKMTRNELKIHVTDTCIKRLIQCEHCQRDIKFCDMPNHLDVCPEMKVSCELNCHTIVPRENMVQHLEQECSMVVEMCKLGCGTKMTRNELKIHVTDTCILRLIQCEYCNNDVEFCDMPNHLDVCPKMKVSCELACNVIMCRENLKRHLEELCPEKDLACPFVKYRCEVGLLKRKYLSQHLEEKRTEHLELKLNAMEEIILEQSEESKQHRDEIKHLKLKLTRLENSFYNEMQRGGDKTDDTIKVNKLSEQISTLCSINNSTMLDWKIEDITEFTRTVHQPQKHRLPNGVILNTYFQKNSTCVSFDHEHGIHLTTVIAKFMICLYSNTKMKVMKQYKHDISQFLTGDVMRKIARIPNSDIQELSRVGATDITLEMYITIMRII